VACLNARDRNVLGFRRDLLTAAAYGVDEFLFVYGDRPETGRRSDDLTVRTMLEQARMFDERLRLGVSARLTVLPAWKREADFLFVQVSFSLDQLLAWRRDTDFDGPVYAGVLVVPSPGAARKLAAQVPQLAVPQTVVEALESDRPPAWRSLAIWCRRFATAAPSTASTSSRSTVLAKRCVNSRHERSSSDCCFGLLAYAGSRR
jgi:5,10-methylenetetrahydrofolate reductase